MSGLTCEEARELLPLLAIDALDVDERDVLEDHLASCSECQEEAASYAETAAVLALALPQVDPPSGLKGKLLTAARRPFVLPDEDARPLRAQRRDWRTTATGAVAAAALLLAAGTSIWAMNLRTELMAQSAQIATLTE